MEFPLILDLEALPGLDSEVWLSREGPSGKTVVKSTLVSSLMDGSLLSFATILVNQAFSKGSGKYMLHTVRGLQSCICAPFLTQKMSPSGHPDFSQVIVHSGGVSSGHYYTFVRLPQEGTLLARWLLARSCRGNLVQLGSSCR